MKKRLRFEHLTTEDGLSQNTILCIFQDSKGFLWLGTESGLNRYDGYEIKTYEHESDNPGSLSSNTILAVCEDHSGTLWVGTNDGLNKFDRTNEIFVSFKDNAEKPGNLSDSYILSLCEGQNGFLWVGTKKGLNRYDKKNKTFTHFPHTSEDANDLPDNAECVKVILKDSGGVLWIGTPIGLYKFKPQKEKPELYPIDIGGDEENEIRAICKDQHGMLWVGINNGGLFRFDPKRGEFIEYYKYNPKKNPNCLSHNNIYSIIEDPQSGNLWIGTKGDGLNQFNPKTKTFVHYIEDPWSPTSLSNDNIWSLYQDKAGLIWVGTEEGLNKLDKRKNEFRHWTEMPTEENSLNHKYIWAIFEDKSGIFW
ncbi:MAG: histidine kinase, partial [Candidatus Aminicenantes bacterium]|nr:histidine kinase [Candidatus Aminicenantes bacterium]NIM84567.1 histidine kinase [Candidatus Aminicenantes bacterium]NIN24087.1 histidine kinase [Candidatus Aminicenantes bacterium]NIN47793.1 histidine kinase [Candidatus Aminicenantes bacterium]NIN90731.1 histidine kinase [Candidatus Aminicenantes bacterium]